jgi:hypothetical protein
MLTPNGSIDEKKKVISVSQVDKDSQDENNHNLDFRDDSAVYHETIARARKNSDSIPRRLFSAQTQEENSSVKSKE